MADLKVSIGNLTLKNPVTVASGTAGYGEELARYGDIAALGAVFTKGLSINPRPGNTGSRIIETPAGVMNSIGLENVGIEKFLSVKLPFLEKSGATVIPNVAGHSIEENVELCRALGREKGIAALELNVSCPNVKEGGLAFAKDECALRQLVEKCRAESEKPLIVKLSPNVEDIAKSARAAKDAGADAVSAVNTFLGMKIDLKTGKPYFENTFAGLSGPAIRPIALRMVYEICAKVDIPVIGLGGISSAEDAIEFIYAGAFAISVGAANMADPAAAFSILEKINLWCDARGIKSLEEIRGSAQKR
ncbi:MAG: dihydroorotate dehydrogenase [Spirochaetota bacterium]